MNTIAFAVSAASLVVIMSAWFSYLATIPRGKVPVRPIGTLIMQCVGMGMAILAIVLSYQASGLSVAVTIPAAIALIMGPLFFWLLSQRKTPIGDLKVKVGDKLLPFEAITSEGVSFHTDEFTGQRIFLKFFRGGW